MLTQIDDVMVPVVPGPLDDWRPKPPTPLPPNPPLPPRGRLVGLFLDGVIWFAIFGAASGFGLLASAIFDDIRTIAGF